MLRNFTALALAVVAVGLMFVQAGSSFSSAHWSAASFSILAVAERRAEDGKWVQACDILSCALAHAPASDQPRYADALDSVQAEIDDADAMSIEQGLAQDGQALWRWLGASKAERVLGPRVGAHVAAASVAAVDDLSLALNAELDVKDRPADVAPALVMLLCLHRLGAFRGGFADALARQASTIGSGLRSSLGATDTLSSDQSWQAVWSVCQSSGRLERAALILRCVQNMQDLRMAVIACGATQDAASKLNAVLGVLQEIPEQSDALGSECIRWVAEWPQEAEPRLDALHQAAYEGPAAIYSVLRGPAWTPEWIGGPAACVARLADRLVQALGVVGFTVLKLALIAVLAMPLALATPRWLAFSRQESKQMAKWTVVFLAVVVALVVQLEPHSLRAQGAPPAVAPPQSSQGAIRPRAGGGWLWAGPLTLLAMVAQGTCVMKARERFHEIADAERPCPRAMGYLRFYAEAPVFIGFLGSVCGAILLQVLAAGQLIYLAYVSTASGMLAFLWIQHQYVIVAESRVAGPGEGE